MAEPIALSDALDETLETLGQPWLLREQCRTCGEPQRGILLPRTNGQRPVRCAACGAWVYHAPKTETGEQPRSVTTVRGVKPRQRARILERATRHCELCGAQATHVGHVLSVDDGLVQIEDGLLTERELNADENLVALCDQCNLGFGRRSLPLRLLVALLRARLRDTDVEDAP